MDVKTRKQFFQELFPAVPPFRYRQVLSSLFETSFLGWRDVTVLPREMREALSSSVFWMSVRDGEVLKSQKGDTEKAILECGDGARIETVLMKNARGHGTVCVSSQVGCAMGCVFCATGNAGFRRNLTEDEIVDQFRFWQYRLAARARAEGGAEPMRLSNVVFMGMGEPLANYEAVRTAIRIILENTSIGSTRITVSTSGLMPAMKRLLSDPLWPSVRMAISLHSADPDIRKRLMPSSFDSFLDELLQWTKDYCLAHRERRQYLTFEYILLRGVNDRREDAEKLIRFIRKVGKVKVNLIPYNQTANFSQEKGGGGVADFLAILKQSGIVTTIRKSLGDDISAACGQLAAREEKSVLSCQENVSPLRYRELDVEKI